MLKLDWRPCDKGLWAVLPYEETKDWRVTARLRLGDQMDGTLGVSLDIDIECESGSMRFSEWSWHPDPASALAAFGDSWRGLMARARVAAAAWEAYP